MAVNLEKKSEPQDVVEHFRSTGYDGREPWIAALDPIIGARVVAVRQLEACATHPACAWRDEVDDEPGLWQFMRECLLEPLESLARIVEANIPEGSAGLGANTQGDKLSDIAWQTVRRLLGQLRSAEPSRTSYPETAVNFLLAVMVLRQIVDADARGEAAAKTRFVPFSTNVHPTFLPDLLGKLGSTVIDLASPPTLSELIARF